MTDAAQPGRLACPACGVAVVPGYVRCPKCHAGLPFGTGRQKRTTIDPGGTSMAAINPSASNRPAVLRWVLSLLILAVAVFGLDRWYSSSSSTSSDAQPSTNPLLGPTNVHPVARPPINGQIVVPAPSTTTAAPVAPNPETLANDLHLALQHLRVYASVHAAGTKLEVRSAQCNEADMAATVAKVRDNLRGAGLTRWKCIEESGQPVFERDL